MCEQKIACGKKNYVNIDRANDNHWVVGSGRVLEPQLLQNGGVLHLKFPSAHLLDKRDQLNLSSANFYILALISPSLHAHGI